MCSAVIFYPATRGRPRRLGGRRRSPGLGGARLHACGALGRPFASRKSSAEIRRLHCSLLPHASRWPPHLPATRRSSPASCLRTPPTRRRRPGLPWRRVPGLVPRPRGRDRLARAGSRLVHGQGGRREGAGLREDALAVGERTQRELQYDGGCAGAAAGVTRAVSIVCMLGSGQYTVFQHQRTLRALTHTLAAPPHAARPLPRPHRRSWASPRSPARPAARPPARSRRASARASGAASWRGASPCRRRSSG